MVGKRTSDKTILIGPSSSRKRTMQWLARRVGPEILPSHQHPSWALYQKNPPTGPQAHRPTGNQHKNRAPHKRIPTEAHQDGLQPERDSLTVVLVKGQPVLVKDTRQLQERLSPGHRRDTRQLPERGVLGNQYGMSHRRGRRGTLRRRQRRLRRTRRRRRGRAGAGAGVGV